MTYFVLSCVQQSGTESSDECETHSLAKQQQQQQQQKPMQAESLCIWSGTPSVILSAVTEKNHNFGFGQSGLYLRNSYTIQSESV